MNIASSHSSSLYNWIVGDRQPHQRKVWSSWDQAEVAKVPFSELWRDYGMLMMVACLPNLIR
jgi:hypothetical protein